MNKIFVILSAIVFAFVVTFSLHENSRENHSIFYIKGESLYETAKIEQDLAFSIAFFLIESFPFLKQRISTGEYEVNKGDSVLSVIRRMFHGERVKRKITFPE
ncbi:MAG: hypothetical protein LBB34_01815, partial [Holosporales bacterium]|nr:hypothetical protein [Holosporales bacterium]